MISSEDVRRVTFERAMRGYRCEDVDDYLKQVADAMDALAAESDDLQNKIRILGQRIDQYRAEEDTLRTTMLNAQRMGENVIKEAKLKAAETIRAANIKADDREQRARDEVELAQQEVVTLKREAEAFKKMLLAKYREHIEMLSTIPEYSDSEPAPESTMPPAAPAESEPQPQPQPVQEEPQPAPEQPAPKPAAKGKKVDTVEFAIAPKDEDEPQPEELTAEKRKMEQQVNALFGAGEQRQAAPRTKGATKPKASRKPKAAEAKDEGLPAAFDSFEGVDFDS